MEERISSLELFNNLVAETVGNPQKYFLSSESQHHLDSTKQINEIEEDIDDANINVPSQSPTVKDNSSNTSCTNFLSSLQKLLQFSVQEIEKSKSEFRKQLDAKDQIFNLLKEKFDVKCAEVEQTKAMMNGVIVAREKEIENLKVEVMSAHQNTSQIKQQYSDVNRHLEQKERENKILLQQISSSSSEIEKITNEIDSIKKSNSKESEQFQQTISELNIQIEQLKQKEERSSQESRHLSKQLEDAQKHLETLTHDLEQALLQKQTPPQVIQVQSPVDKAKDGEIKILRARLESKDAEIQTLKLQSSSNKFNDLNWKHNWERELDKMKTHLLFKEQEIKTLTEQVIDLQRKLAEHVSPNPSPNANDIQISITTPIDDASKKRKRTQGSTPPLKAPKVTEGALQLLKASQALTPMRSADKKSPVRSSDVSSSKSQKQLEFS